MSRTRLERVRASVGIASLALQQIEDDLSADDVDQEELAAILRELIEDTDPPGGFIAVLAQMLTVAARRAEQIEPDRDGDASCPLPRSRRPDHRQRRDAPDLGCPRPPPAGR